MHRQGCPQEIKASRECQALLISVASPSKPTLPHAARGRPQRDFPVRSPASPPRRSSAYRGCRRIVAELQVEGTRCGCPSLADMTRRRYSAAPRPSATGAGCHGATGRQRIPRMQRTPTLSGRGSYQSQLQPFCLSCRHHK